MVHFPVFLCSCRELESSLSRNSLLQHKLLWRAEPREAGYGQIKCVQVGSLGLSASAVCAEMQG